MTGVAIAAVRSGDEYGLLDPRSTAANGSKAVAQLLKQRGVDIEIVTTAAGAEKAAGPGTTVLVSDPEALNRRQQADLRAERCGKAAAPSSSLPAPRPTKALVRGAQGSGPAANTQPTPPDCDFPAAERAGDAEIGGLRYSVSNDQADLCYVHQGMPSLLRLPDKAHGDTSAPVRRATPCCSELPNRSTTSDSTTTATPP